MDKHEYQDIDLARNAFINATENMKAADEYVKFGLIKMEDAKDTFQAVSENISNLVMRIHELDEGVPETMMDKFGNIKKKFVDVPHPALATLVGVSIIVVLTICVFKWFCWKNRTMTEKILTIGLDIEEKKMVKVQKDKDLHVKEVEEIIKMELEGEKNVTIKATGGIIEVESEREEKLSDGIIKEELEEENNITIKDHEALVKVDLEEEKGLQANTTNMGFAEIQKLELDQEEPLNGSKIEETKKEKTYGKEVEIDIEKIVSDTEKMDTEEIQKVELNIENYLSDTKNEVKKILELYSDNDNTSMKSDETFKENLDIENDVSIKKEMVETIQIKSEKESKGGGTETDEISKANLEAENEVPNTETIQDGNKLEDKENVAYCNTEKMNTEAIIMRKLDKDKDLSNIKKGGVMNVKLAGEKDTIVKEFEGENKVEFQVKNELTVIESVSDGKKKEDDEKIVKLGGEAEATIALTNLMMEMDIEVEKVKKCIGTEGNIKWELEGNNYKNISETEEIGKVELEEVKEKHKMAVYSEMDETVVESAKNKAEINVESDLTEIESITGEKKKEEEENMELGKEKKASTVETDIIMKSESEREKEKTVIDTKEKIKENLARQKDITFAENEEIIKVELEGENEKSIAETEETIKVELEEEKGKIVQETEGKVRLDLDGIEAATVTETEGIIKVELEGQKDITVTVTEGSVCSMEVIEGIIKVELNGGKSVTVTKNKAVEERSAKAINVKEEVDKTLNLKLTGGGKILNVDFDGEKDINVTANMEFNEKQKIELDREESGIDEKNEKITKLEVPDEKEVPVIQPEETINLKLNLENIVTENDVIKILDVYGQKDDVDREYDGTVKVNLNIENNISIQKETEGTIQIKLEEGKQENDTKTDETIKVYLDEKNEFSDLETTVDKQKLEDKEVMVFGKEKHVTVKREIEEPIKVKLINEIDKIKNLKFYFKLDGQKYESVTKIKEILKRIWRQRIWKRGNNLKYLFDGEKKVAFTEQFANASKYDGEGVKDSTVHIRIQQIKGAKILTTVHGLSKEYDLYDLCELCKMEFSCNGTVLEHPVYGEILQLQGDQRQKVCEFLSNTKLALRNQLKVHGF